jgi:hypothetical protein
MPDCTEITIPRGYPKTVAPAPRTASSGTASSGPALSRAALSRAASLTVAAIESELARLARYDDESLVHEAWVRQRYEAGLAASYAPARAEAVRTAWHEAGHAVAALAVGARFSSASIRAGSRSAGRLHAVSGGGDLSFVVDAAGQVAERLRDWSLPEGDVPLDAFLAQWRADGGDARRFRAGGRARFAGDAAAAWRYSVQVLAPLRPRIARLARGLLVHPRHLPYQVAATIAGLPAVPIDHQQ